MKFVDDSNRKACPTASAVYQQISQQAIAKSTVVPALCDCIGDAGIPSAELLRLAMPRYSAQP
jgi:hypothetical protein